MLGTHVPVCQYIADITMVLEPMYQDLQERAIVFGPMYVDIQDFRVPLHQVTRTEIQKTTVL